MFQCLGPAGYPGRQLLGFNAKTMQTDRSKFIRGFWALFKPYWFSEEKVTARLLLAAIIVLSLGMVYINVRVNEWHALFFNSLQEKDQSEFFHQVGRFVVVGPVDQELQRRGEMGKGQSIPDRLLFGIEIFMTGQRLQIGP